MEFYIFDLKGVHWDKQTFSCEEHLVNAKACEEEEENIKQLWSTVCGGKFSWPVIIIKIYQINVMIDTSS